MEIRQGSNPPRSSLRHAGMYLLRVQRFKSRHDHPGRPIVPISSPLAGVGCCKLWRSRPCTDECIELFALGGRSCVWAFDSGQVASLIWITSASVERATILEVRTFLSFALIILMTAIFRKVWHQMLRKVISTSHNIIFLITKSMYIARYCVRFLYDFENNGIPNTWSSTKHPKLRPQRCMDLYCLPLRRSHPRWGRIHASRQIW